jgi:hypothetical protein
MQRLKMLAEPFVDTPDTVVTRLLDHFDRTQVPPPSTGQRQTEGPPSLPLQRYDPLSPPGLTHTKVLSAIVDGRSAANWNDLVDQAHLAAMRRVNDANSLWTLSKSQTHKGRRTDRATTILRTSICPSRRSTLTMRGETPCTWRESSVSQFAWNLCGEKSRVLQTLECVALWNGARPR